MGVLVDALSKLERIETPRDYIGASSVGDECQRKIWFQYTGAQANKVVGRQRMIYQTGHLLEKMILDDLELAGFLSERPCEGNNNLAVSCKGFEVFRGHMDGLIAINGVDYILDIKTANDASFNRFVKHGLRSWSESYHDQLQAYMGMTGFKHAILLCLNKNTGEMHEETVNFNVVHYEFLINKAQQIAQAKSPPPRVSANPMFFKCKMCSYSEVCHNGGSKESS